MDYGDLYRLEFSTHETTKRVLAKVQAERDALKAQLAEVRAAASVQRPAASDERSPDHRADRRDPGCHD